MTTSINHAIAHLLAASNVGLFRKQLFDKIDPYFTGNDIEKVSAALFKMRGENHVEKSARQGLDGCRWSLTPQGRAYYSVLNDEPETLAPDKSETRNPTPPITQSITVTDSFQDNITRIFKPVSHAGNTEILTFDLENTLDRALHGIVKLIKTEAETPPMPAIERKAEKLQLLEKLENNDLFPGNMRALLGYIRMDLEQLDGVES